jgi:D-glycero-D-manno-heptose 1,7-bisphosphate phosphatase
MAPAVSKAAFLDRDGVINVDKGYVYRWEDFEFIAGAIEGLRLLQRLEYRLVIVTNQSGVARGYYSVADVNQLSATVVTHLREQGVAIAGVYFCPHHPAGEVAEFARECECRKPMPGMITRASSELGVDLSSSVLIGDKPSDIEAATSAGVGQAFLITDEVDPAVAPTPLDGVAGRFPSLLECARFLARN